MFFVWMPLQQDIYSEKRFLYKAVFWLNEMCVLQLNSTYAKVYRVWRSQLVYWLCRQGPSIIVVTFHSVSCGSCSVVTACEKIAWPEQCYSAVYVCTSVFLSVWVVVSVCLVCYDRRQHELVLSSASLRTKRSDYHILHYYGSVNEVLN